MLRQDNRLTDRLILEESQGYFLEQASIRYRFKGGDQKVSLNEYGAHIWDSPRSALSSYPAGAAARVGSSG